MLAGDKIRKRVEDDVAMFDDVLDLSTGVLDICGVENAAVEEIVLHSANRLGQPIRRLYAARCCLRNIPCNLPTFAPLLAELDLSGNALVELPEGLGALRALRKCYIMNNRLRSLPQDLVAPGSCPDLRELWADHNELEELPSDWGGLRSIVCLQLGWNRIVSLPASFAKMARLRQLLVQQNQLLTLPDPLPPNLWCLAVRSNRLQELPSSVGSCRYLRRALLGANHIRRIPCSFGGCPIEELYVAGCGMDYVPFEFSQLHRQLRWLDISDNKIAELPDWIESFRVMRWLDCEGNRIENFSPVVAKWLSTIQGATFSGNPLVAPFDIVLGCDTGNEVPQVLRALHGPPAEPKGCCKPHTRWICCGRRDKRD